MKTGLALNEFHQTENRNNPIQSFQRKPVIRKISEAEAPAPVVSIHGYQYRVDLGQESSPRFHQVSKSKECSCGAPYCEAIEAVRLYLQAGGLRAPDPEGMPPCPICGSRTYRDRNWDGKYTKTLGWRCEKGGLRHFLEAKAEWIKKLQKENPWLIPPAPDYPGVRRDELMTWEECQAANQRLVLGDDPGI
jgi:hypothetical protein